MGQSQDIQTQPTPEADNPNTEASEAQVTEEQVEAPKSFASLKEATEAVHSLAGVVAAQQSKIDVLMNERTVPDMPQAIANIAVAAVNQRAGKLFWLGVGQNAGAAVTGVYKGGEFVVKGIFTGVKEVFMLPFRAGEALGKACTRKKDKIAQEVAEEVTEQVTDPEAGAAPATA